MLFLLALLFFVLGTGTSAVKISPVPITSGLVSHEDYIRLHGYWVPTAKGGIRYPLVVYIGPEDGSPLEFNVADPNNLHVFDVVCNGVHNFVRLLDSAKYPEVTIGEDLPNIEKDYLHDRLKIELPWLEGKRRAKVMLIRSLTVEIGLTNMRPERLSGHWKPTMKKPVWAYIYPDGKSVVLYYYGDDNVKTVCDRKHRLERILNVEDYGKVTGEEYSAMNKGDFPTIIPPFRGDKVSLNIILPKKYNDIKKASSMTVKLESTKEVAFHKLEVQIDSGLERDRACGYWRPKIPDDVKSGPPAVVHIPKDGQSVIFYSDDEVLNDVCNGKYAFERMVRKAQLEKKLTAEDYEKVPSPLPSTITKYKTDTVTMLLSEDKKRVTVALID